MNSQPFAQSSVMAALVEAVSALPEALQWQVVQWARSLPTSSEPVSWAIDQFITITPGVCGDRPHLVGHRIRVQDIVLWSDHWGYSPDEILHHYPSLTLSDIDAALAYYHSHLSEIRQDMAADQALVEQMVAETPSLVQQKLRQVRATATGA